MRFIIGLSIALLATSCSNATKNSSDEGKQKLENFTNDKTASKQHLFLRITEEVKTDSSKVYVAKSLFDTDTVGLQVEVLNIIQPGVVNGKPVEGGFQEGVIKLSSIGPQSDNLVKALGVIFNENNISGMTDAVIAPTVFSSNTTAVDLDKSGTYSFKLFLDNEAGEPAELFAVLDTHKKAFELSEKDSTYRKLIISALAKK